MPSTLRLRTVSVAGVGASSSGLTLALNNPRSLDSVTSLTAIDPSATRRGTLGRQYVVFTGDNTGATDVTAAIQAMFDLAANRTTATYGKAGYVFCFPAGSYRISDTLLLQDWFSPVVEGMTEGVGATRFVWYGAADRPMIKFSSVSDGVIRNLTLNTAGGNVQTGISIASRVGGNPISTNCRVERCVIEGADKFTNGVYIDSTANDNNNEFHQLVGCNISRCTYGFRVWGSQAHKWLLRDTSINFCSRNVYIERGVYGSIERSNVGYSTDWDIYLGSFAVQFRITELNSEGSKRFLFAAVDNSHMGFDISSVRWDGIGPDVDFDYVLNIASPGPISLRDVKLTTANGKRWYARCGAGNQIGGLMSSGLLVRQNGCPSDDAVQTAMIAEPDIRVVETGSLVWDDAGVREAYVRPATDLTRLALTPLPGPYAVVESTDPPSLANPFHAASGRRRSFALAFKFIIDSPLSTGVSPNPQLLWVQGFGIHFLHLGGGVYQFRVETSGFATTWVGLTAGVEYQVAVSYDRDNAVMVVRYGGTTTSFGVAPATFAPVSSAIRLGTASGTPGPTDARLNGRIRDIRPWDRALTVAEVQGIV